jgi:hypothetical protein
MDPNPTFSVQETKQHMIVSGSGSQLQVGNWDKDGNMCLYLMLLLQLRGDGLICVTNSNAIHWKAGFGLFPLGCVPINELGIYKLIIFKCIGIHNDTAYKIT